jgi:YD repeat-containing protein
MTWNYRLIRHAEHIALHEVYYDGEGKVISWTANAVSFVADLDEGAQTVIGSLEMALADARKYPVLVASELPQDRTRS